MTVRPASSCRSGCPPGGRDRNHQVPCRFGGDGNDSVKTDRAKNHPFILPERHIRETTSRLA